MGCQISIDTETNSVRTIAIVGLDGSGKSSIAHQMMAHDGSENFIPIPTAAVDFQEQSLGASVFRIYDCGGFGRYRSQWSYFINESDGVVFVIDRSDKARMSCVREEISEVISQCQQLGIPLLILVNKTDIDSPLNVDDIRSITNINGSGIDYTIKECSAKTGDGIISGRDWLLQHIKPKDVVSPLQQ